jgi:hypothetical protein
LVNKGKQPAINIYGGTEAKRHKTVTRSFRIRQDWIDILTEDAESQGISVNVLMNLIIRKYANFDKLCQDRNVICMSKKTFRELITGISLEHMMRAGEKTGLEDMQKMLDKLGLPSNFDSFTYLVKRYFGSPGCADWFRYFGNSRENQIHLNLQHNLGREWSVFLEKYLLSFLDTLNIDFQTRIYDYALNIKLTRPPR